MDPSTTENGVVEIHTDRVLYNFLMAPNTKATGRKVSTMARVPTPRNKEPSTTVNGSTESITEWELFCGRTGPYIRENGGIVGNLAEASSLGSMELFMRVNGKRASIMERASCRLVMARSMLECLKMASSWGEFQGNQITGISI